MQFIINKIKKIIIIFKQLQIRNNMKIESILKIKKKFFTKFSIFAEYKKIVIFNTVVITADYYTEKEKIKK